MFVIENVKVLLYLNFELVESDWNVRVFDLLK